MNDLELWQQIAALVATALVLAAAIWARRRRQTPGRHRPGQAIAGPDVFEQVLALTEPDDWTADLPTVQLRLVVDADFEALSTALSEVKNMVRQRWQTECPIFAALADEYGYDAARGFDTQLAAA
ncbi:hypothetical protein PP713_08490 [Mycobacterium sp. CSUR Q5927]|nr:hypothetical protein [Mycobacterium sp. CSUR Q5927]